MNLTVNYGIKQNYTTVQHVNRKLKLNEQTTLNTWLQKKKKNRQVITVMKFK